jgi:hypothetical protein
MLDHQNKQAAWARWYGLFAWRRRARAQLLHEPLCRMCAREGLAVPAKVADHIHPHKGDWNEFILGELQSLCLNHHNQVKQVIELRGYDPTVGADGYPIDPQHPANKGA